MQRCVGLLFCLLLAGCATFPDNDVRQDQCTSYLASPARVDPAARVRKSVDVALWSIQLTDEGELVDRCQWTDALLELSRDEPLTIVLYVHGWKHNGDPDDADLMHFDRLLHEIAAENRKVQKTQPRNVVGLYVAWNGKSVSMPVLQELSFWSRKQAADRVSQSAALTKFIGAVKHVRAVRKFAPGVSQSDFLVLMGHSFGARILFAATSQLLVFESQTQHPGRADGEYGIMRGPADLIVLLNPAFEASRYTSLDAINRGDKEHIHPQQQPLLLTISTDNDWATKTAFPIGQKFGLETHERQVATLGNYDGYVTHDLKPVDAASRPSDAWPDTFCASDVCLVRRDRKDGERSQQKRNPFIVATTSPPLLDGHNGIWEPQFQEWLLHYLLAVEARRVNAAVCQKPNAEGLCPPGAP